MSHNQKNNKEEFAASDFFTYSVKNNEVYSGGYLGFFVYPGYKLTIYKQERYDGDETSIDNTTGDSVKKVFWNNQNTSNVIIGSIKIEKNNIVLQDCPYMVNSDLNSDSTTIDNTFYSLSYTEPESEPEP